MSWTHVNSTKGSGSGAGQANMTLTGCQQGDLLLWIGTDGTVNNWEDTGISDDAGNSYTLCSMSMSASGHQRIAIWMARHATGAGTVIINGPEGNAFTGYIGAAYRHSLGTSAVPILDGVKGRDTPAGSGTDSFVSPAVDSHSADGLAVGVHLNDENSSTLVAGTGYTLRQSQDIFSANPLILEDKPCGVESVASTASAGSNTYGVAITLIFTDASLLPPQTITQFQVAVDGDDESGFRTAASVPGIASGAFTADTGIDGVWVSLTGNGPYFADCGCWRFNTGAVLPADAVIQWARVVHYVLQAEGNDGSIGWKASYYDFGGTPMVAADWHESTGPDTNIYFSDEEEQARGWVSTPAVQTYSLKDLTGIMRSGEVNAQGFSGYTGIREAAAIAITPTGNNYVRYASREHTTEPETYLEVAWYVPSSDNPRSAGSSLLVPRAGRAGFKTTRGGGRGVGRR